MKQHKFHEINIHAISPTCSCVPADFFSKVLLRMLEAKVENTNTNYVIFKEQVNKGIVTTSPSID